MMQTYCFPRDKAAKYLNVSVNLLKRICRDNRIERWPYRKLQSLDHLIKNAQEQAHADPKGAKEIIEELQHLKLEIYANPDLELDDRVKKLRQVNYKNDYRQRCHSDRHEHPGRGSRKQPPPPADMEGAMVAAFASMQEQELEQMQDDEQRDEEEEEQQEQEQAWEHEHEEEQQQQQQLQQRHQQEQQQQQLQQRHQEERQRQEARRQEQEEQQQRQDEQQQKQEEQQQRQEQQQQQQQQQQRQEEQQQQQEEQQQRQEQQQQRQEEQQQKQEGQQQRQEEQQQRQEQQQQRQEQQQQQAQGKREGRRGQSYSGGFKPEAGPGCNAQNFQASAEQGLFGVTRAPQQQQQEQRSSSPPTRAAGNASLRSRNASKGSANRSRTPTFDGTSLSLAQGKQGGPAPSATDEILPRAGSGVPGHSCFQSTLQGTFGGDFVSEDGCIDGQPYEPEMVVRLNTGGEERTLKRSSLAKVFHLPIQAAADQLDMGQTWLKKICRDFSIERWPYRKLQSLDHLIRSVEEQSISDPVGANDIIRELRQIKKEIYQNPDAKLDDKIKRLRQANYKLEYKQRHNDSSPMTTGNGNGGGGMSGTIEKQRSQQPGGAGLQYAMAQAHAQFMKKREQDTLKGSLQEASAMLKQGKMPTMEQLQALMQHQKEQQKQQEPQQKQDPASEQQQQQQQQTDPQNPMQGLPSQPPPHLVDPGAGQELLKHLGLPGMEVGKAGPGQPQLGLPNPLLAGCPPQIPPLDQDALLKSLLGGLSSPAAGGIAPLPPDLLQGALAPLPTGTTSQPQQPAAAAAAAAAAAVAAAAVQPGSSSSSSSPWAALGLPLLGQDLLQPPPAMQPPLHGQGRVKEEPVPLQVPESLQPLLASLQPLTTQQLQQQQQQGGGRTALRKGLRSRRQRRRLPNLFLVQDILGMGAFAHAPAGVEEQCLRSQQPQQGQQPQQQQQPPQQGLQHQLQYPEQPHASATIATPALGPDHKTGQASDLVSPTTALKGSRATPSDLPFPYERPPPPSMTGSDAGGLGMIDVPEAAHLQGAGAPQHHQVPLLSQLPAPSPEAVSIAPAALPHPSFEVPQTRGPDPFSWAPASLLPQPEGVGQGAIYGTRQATELLHQQQQQQQQEQQQQEEDELLGLFIQDPQEHVQPQQGIKRSREGEGVGAGAAEAAKHNLGKAAAVSGGDGEYAWGGKHARLDAAHLLE
ncbi:hypothetical protein DUNSADRAFT_12594 [Dunaliella salina]|uniref:RWP-RK domain-containing protein n=1 Tax=Dunaliella salina TaxID=3046 RepID=A0ABQ7GB03_DUNSA|nr:hypothetical protein DUNSADRAFT_12594 [Dunaliella salina]|eukprot:KAF5831783.1 hypothetical protein DUNSADRAFT_12594 [Dunaliella salina]